MCTSGNQCSKISSLVLNPHSTSSSDVRCILIIKVIINTASLNKPLHLRKNKDRICSRNTFFSSFPPFPLMLIYSSMKLARADSTPCIDEEFRERFFSAPPDGIHLLFTHHAPAEKICAPLSISVSTTFADVERCISGAQNNSVVIALVVMFANRARHIKSSLHL